MSAARVERFHVVESQEPEKPKQANLEARLLDEVKKYYDLTKASRARRYYLWLVVACFSKGIHFVDYSPFRGTLEEWPQKKIDSCLFTPSGLLQFTVEVIASQNTTSNARTVPTTEGEDDPKTKAVLRGLTDYAEYLDWLFYRRDPVERQTEAKMIPQRGVWNFLEYDKTLGPKLELPQYEEQTGQVCGECGEEVGGEDNGNNMAGRAPMASIGDRRGNVGRVDNGTIDPSSQQTQAANVYNPAAGPGVQTQERQGVPSACPACGSQNITAMTTGLGNKGNVQARQGAPRRHVVDSFQVEVYDRQRDPAKSKYLIYDESLFVTEAKATYPWLKSVKGSANLGNYADGFLGLHYLSQLETLIANTGQLDQSEPKIQRPTAFSQAYKGAFLDPLLCWRRRCWLDKEVYADWTTDDLVATQLPGVAQLVPPGTKLIDLFPDGLCIHIINGAQVVKLENQDKNKVWSFCGFRVPSEGLHGTGVASLISMIRGHDLLTSFQLQGVLMAALGIIVVDSRVGQVRNVPGTVVRIEEGGRMPNEPISSLAARLDMGGAAAVQTAEPVKQGWRNHIADMSMASSPNASGMQREGMKTATGVKYQEGVVNTLTNPPLELYAAHRAQVIGQAVELERENNIRPRAFGKFGSSVKQWFNPMEVPEDVKFATAEDSWQTRTMETRRQDIGGAIQIGVGQGKLNPMLEEQALRVFGLDEDVDDYEDWAVKAEKRLDAMKSVLPGVMQEAQSPEAQQAMQTPDPMTGQPAYNPVTRLIELAQAMPQPMDAPGHQHYMRFYEGVYNTDEWDAFPPVLQQAIAMLWQAHEQAGMMQAQQMAAADPENQAAAQQQQADERGAEAEHGRQVEAADRGEQSADAQHGRAMEQHEAKESSADRAHERTLELEKVKQKGEKTKHGFAMMLEKTRGKARQAKGKKR